MKTKNGKFFIIIGVLLIIAGVVLLPNDRIIGMIGIILGAYNIYKGIQLLRGIQPLLIRKQQERDQEIDDELKNKMHNNEQKNQNKQNRK